MIPERGPGYGAIRDCHGLNVLCIRSSRSVPQAWQHVAYPINQANTQPIHTGLMKTSRLSFLRSVVAVLALTLRSSAAETKKPQIGVSLLTLANPFFRDLGEAMKDEAGKHGMEVVVVSGEFDAAKQRN